MVDQQLSAEQVAAIRQSYAFTEPAIDLGVLDNGGEPVTDARVRIPLSMLTRHGLIAGATGTGKTTTLQLLAESLSAAGVPVLAADVKGDLSGVALPGVAGDKLAARTAANGQAREPGATPAEFYALGGRGSGVPLRATVSAFGPLLLSKVLGLNDTRSSALTLLLTYADKAGLPLLDLADLSQLLKYLTSDEGKPELRGIGGVSTATIGVILRKITELASQGGDVFFGEPESDITDLLRTDTDGRGIVSVLELPDVRDRPALFSTFLVWLLADLHHDLPEAGDVDRPRLVFFFFDEARLLFDGASKAFCDQITQTVRLVRSKGVGVFLITQQPTDLPEQVLAQLGSRVQHQLRARTPNEAKALRATVNTYPTGGYDLGQALQGLGMGQAIVTVMNTGGAPTEVAWTRVFAPAPQMGAAPAGTIDQMVLASALHPRYAQPVDRESAQEILAAKLAAGARAAQTEAASAQPPQSRAAPRGTGSRGRTERTVAEKVIESSAFKQFARSAGRETVRSLFGIGRRT